MPGILTDPLAPDGELRPFAFTPRGPVDLRGTPENAEARKVAAVTTLSGFIRYMWPELVPGKSLVWGPHIDVVCYGLECLAFGQVSNNELVINIPPRHLKSVTVAQAFPAWLWLQNPSLQILTISTGDRVITQNNRGIRRVVESPRYRELVDFARSFLREFTDIPEWSLASDQNEKRRFENTAGGICQGLPAGADVIGIGADLIIIDDPIDTKEVKNKSPDAIAAELWKIIDNYGGTWDSRLNDPDRSCRVTIMQRLAVMDLAGFLLDGVEDGTGKKRGGGVTGIVLPTEYDPDHPHVCSLDWRTEPGELLFPERFSAQKLAHLKTTWDATEYAAQHAQRPVPKGGILFSLDGWTTYAEHPREIAKLANENGGFVFSSADVANKAGIRNAYTVIVVFAYLPPTPDYPAGRLFVLHVERAQVEYMGLDALYNTTRKSWRTAFDLVEDAANGVSLLQNYGPKPGHNAIAVSPYEFGGKEVRANHTLKRLGRVDTHGIRRDVSLFVPENAVWLGDFKTEHAHFPRGTYADQVDATSQGVLYIDVIRGTEMDSDTTDMEFLRQAALASLGPGRGLARMMSRFGV
jgi:phage terminase large subunit-like protein